ncbi:TIR domain-containing protein [Delftia acidovorans]|uniref:TIR domain-containing protein n=1 Tax=Delftia acidovorans TaxID=80866 RepID=UPI0018D64CBC|nr:TIR domain-containing protein [Delftia acidovorans]QPR34460.1 TIR domain-containing protein [Delftia acidovorans]
MNYGIFGGASRPQALVRHKIFVSYHHKGDQDYYDSFTKAFHDTYNVVYDNSLERSIDSDNVDYVMRRIRENHITGTSCTIILVGAESPTRKYIDWEISATLEKKHALIGVQLPTARLTPDNQRVFVPGRLFDNVKSGFALWLTWGQITANTTKLGEYIAEAKSRSASKIDNTRPRRLRNG